MPTSRIATPSTRPTRAGPAREKPLRIGGPGTAEVTEFAAAELGARLGLSTISAGRLIADGLDLCHRLPVSTPHHRLKTFDPWTVKQPFPGVYLRRDRYGALHLVEHTGTRALSHTA